MSPNPDRCQLGAPAQAGLVCATAASFHMGPAHDMRRGGQPGMSRGVARLHLWPAIPKTS